MDNLLEMTRDGGVQIRCKETVSEMRTFVEDGMKYGASSGCHDDRVMSAAMASQMMRLLPHRITEKPRHSRKGITNWLDKSTGNGYTEARA